MSTKKKMERLTDGEKQQVTTVFQPLLSNTFGGTNYKKFYLDDAKHIITSHVDAEVKKHKFNSKVVRKCNETRFGVTRATSMEKVLELLSEACLLEEVLEEN